MTKEERAQVAEFIRSNPALTYPKIAKLYSCHKATIFNIAAEFNVSRVRGPKPRLNGEVG
jgi:tellurite resistance protein